MQRQVRQISGAVTSRVHSEASMAHLRWDVYYASTRCKAVLVG